MEPTASREMAALLDRQHGLLTRAQVRASGMSDDRLTAHVDARRWQQVLPRVFATYCAGRYQSDRK